MAERRQPNVIVDLAEIVGLFELRAVRIPHMFSSNGWWVRALGYDTGFGGSFVWGCEVREVRVARS